MPGSDSMGTHLTSVIEATLYLQTTLWSPRLAHFATQYLLILESPHKM